MIEFNIVQKSIEATSTDDDVLHIVGIANTGQEDLSGDVLTKEALLDICEQATQHNLHIDHDKTFNGLLGPITKAELVDEGVKIYGDIVNEEYKVQIQKMLERGVNLGLSVKGSALPQTRGSQKYVSFNLWEISVTPIPCDMGTMGSVMIAKSFNEVAKSLELEEKQMAEEEITQETIIELINTAFNERREEFLEVVRGELKTEYEVALNELKERIETLESKLEDETVDINEEDVVEDPTETDGEAVAETVTESVEEETDEEDEESSEEEESEEDDEEEDEVEKSIDEELLQKRIDELLEKKLETIFSEKKQDDLEFKSVEKTATETETDNEKKAYTPRELAELFSQ